MIDLHHLWMFFDWVKKDSESTNSSAVAARQRAGWCQAWAGQRLQIPPSTFPEFKLGFICPINAKSDTSFLQQKLVRVLFSGLFRASAEFFFFAKSHGNEFFFIGGGNRRRKNKVYFYLLCGEKLKKEVSSVLDQRERGVSVSDGLCGVLRRKFFDVSGSVPMQIQAGFLLWFLSGYYL